MDRASTFADEETVSLIASRFTAVAVSLQEELKSQDAAGEFFRKIAHQRPEPKHTKQGYYIAAPDGTLLKGWMYPRPDDGTMKRYLKEALGAYRAPESIEPIDGSKARPAERTLPEGAAEVELRSKASDADWPAAAANRFDVIKNAVGRDRLWVLKGEIEALGRGEVPDSLFERIIRFHLGDNTRCILERWQPEAIRAARASLRAEGTGYVLEGEVSIEHGTKGYDAKLFGYVEVKDGRLTRFDLLARGRAWGRHNAVPFAPLGKYTLAIAFALPKPGESFQTLPVWNYVEDYVRTQGLRVTSLRSR